LSCNVKSYQDVITLEPGTIVCDSARPTSLFCSNWQLLWPEALLNQEPISLNLNRLQSFRCVYISAKSMPPSQR